MIGQSVETRRFGAEAGIAIGPILFIIAILGILAAAIAAGSGSFTANTSSESARTKASALIQIGENLKIGMDRITMQGGIDPENVIINVDKTENANELFSPSGGGISVPSTAMAETPGTDIWYYVEGAVAGFGTSAGKEIFAVLKVSTSVCTEINARTTGTSATPASAALGDFTTSATSSGTNWPTASPNLKGVTVGCVNNSTSPAGTYFYQIMAIQ